jgi:hypothetical protein
MRHEYLPEIRAINKLIYAANNAIAVAVWQLPDPLRCDFPVDFRSPKNTLLNRHFQQ